MIAKSNNFTAQSTLK